MKEKYGNTHFALNEEQRRTPSSSPSLPSLPKSLSHTPYMGNERRGENGSVSNSTPSPLVGMC
jgi:hypothetical protein